MLSQIKSMKTCRICFCNKQKNIDKCFLFSVFNFFVVLPHISTLSLPILFYFFIDLIDGNLLISPRKCL